MDTETNDQNTPTLSAGNQNESAPTENFEKIVNDSKATLQAEAAAQIKRGRGRPKGTGKKEPGPGPSVGQDPAEDVPGASMQAQVNEMKPLLKDTIKMPFHFAAERYRNPRIEVTDQEAELPAFYLSKFLNAWMPEIEKKGPKEFNLYAFLISSVLLLLKKAPLMRRTVEQRTAEVSIVNTPHPDQNPTPSDSPPPARNGGVSPTAFFGART